MAEHGAGGRAAERREMAARRAGDRAAERYSTTHHLVAMQPNLNRAGPSKGKNRIVLTKQYKVADQAANAANQELVEFYNAMWDVADSYMYSLADVCGRKDESKGERKELMKCFSDLLKKIAHQKSSVIRLGAVPVPFPSHVHAKLPYVFQELMNEKLQ